MGSKLYRYVFVMEVQSSRDIKRKKDEEQIRTKQTSYMKPTCISKATQEMPDLWGTILSRHQKGDEKQIRTKPTLYIKPISKDIQEMPQSRRTSSRDIKRKRDEEQIRTKQTLYIKPISKDIQEMPQSRRTSSRDIKRKRVEEQIRIKQKQQLKPISKDTQEMPDSRGTVLPRHQKKESWGTNKDKTKATAKTYK